MEPKVRLTQKDLVFGIYWAGKKGGLNIWFRDRYIWPLNHKATVTRKRKVQAGAPVKDPRLQELPFDASSSHVAEGEGVAETTT